MLIEWDLDRAKEWYKTINKNNSLISMKRTVECIEFLLNEIEKLNNEKKEGNPKLNKIYNNINSVYCTFDSSDFYDFDLRLEIQYELRDILSDIKELL